MRHGQLSNKPAPVIGVRFERLIRNEQGRLNKAARGFLHHIFGKDINVYIFTTANYRKCMAFCVKHNVPCSRVVAVDSDLEIPEYCQAYALVAYYDVDKYVVQNVTSRGAIKVDAQLWTQADFS